MRQSTNSPTHQLTNSPIHQLTNSPIRLIVGYSSNMSVPAGISVIINERSGLTQSLMPAARSRRCSRKRAHMCGWSACAIPATSPRAPGRRRHGAICWSRPAGTGPSTRRCCCGRDRGHAWRPAHGHAESLRQGSPDPARSRSRGADHRRRSRTADRRRRGQRPHLRQQLERRLLSQDGVGAGRRAAPRPQEMDRFQHRGAATWRNYRTVGGAPAMSTAKRRWCAHRSSSSATTSTWPKVSGWAALDGSTRDCCRSSWRPSAAVSRSSRCRCGRSLNRLGERARSPASKRNSVGRSRASSRSASRSMARLRHAHTARLPDPPAALCA